MTDRISIPALRDLSYSEGAYKSPDGYVSVGVPLWAHVLALVEAVEAAQAVDQQGFSPDTAARFKAALARFDFGEKA